MSGMIMALASTQITRALARSSILGKRLCCISTDANQSSQTGTTEAIESPAELRQATLQEIQKLMPFSWQIGMHRHRPLEARGLQIYLKATAETQDSMNTLHTQPRSPSDSFLRVLYPFKSSPALCDQYRRFNSNTLRWGLLLEDLDTLAGDIAGLHAGLKGQVPATAYVDKISCMTHSAAGEVTLHQDLRLDGQVTWVGRSSMEVLISLSARNGNRPDSVLVENYAQHSDTSRTSMQTSPHNSQQSSSQRDVSGTPAAKGNISTPKDWLHVGFARFVMVMRDAETASKSVAVPQLLPSTDSERALFAQGQEHMRDRKERRDTHWRVKPPTDLEVKLIHQLAVNSNVLIDKAKAGPTDLNKQALPSNSASDTSPAEVPIHATELRNSILMHSQDRNHFSRIFGGHLMRLAFELAFATAALHAGEYCDPVSMEDVAFLQPVPIGRVMQLRAKVVFTHKDRIWVLVEAVLLQPGQPGAALTMTNDFSFQFLCRGGPVLPVVPETVVEALEYVQGHRQCVEEMGEQ